MKTTIHLFCASIWIMGFFTNVKEHKPKLVAAGLAGHLLTEMFANSFHQKRSA